MSCKGQLPLALAVHSHLEKRACISGCRPLLHVTPANYLVFYTRQLPLLRVAGHVVWDIVHTQ